MLQVSSGTAMVSTSSTDGHQHLQARRIYVLPFAQILLLRPYPSAVCLALCKSSLSLDKQNLRALSGCLHKTIK
jgi:hypothetical protein